MGCEAHFELCNQTSVGQQVVACLNPHVQGLSEVYLEHALESVSPDHVRPYTEVVPSRVHSWGNRSVGIDPLKGLQIRVR